MAFARKHTIAVIDNGDFATCNLEILLEGAGFDIAVFRHTSLFWESMLKGKFDCLILNWQMPYVGGVETTLGLRSAGLSIPVIAISNNEYPGERKLAFRSGAVAYFTKPFDEISFLDCIQKNLPPIARS